MVCRKKKIFADPFENFTKRVRERVIADRGKERGRGGGGDLKGNKGP